jgi:hypothetical protein
MVKSMEIVLAKSRFRKPNHGKRKLVRCRETGVIYGSGNDAAEILSEQGISICPMRIQSACRGQQKSAGGFRWDYVLEASTEPATLARPLG